MRRVLSLAAFGGFLLTSAAALSLCILGCQPSGSEHQLQDPGYYSYDVAPDGHTLLLPGPSSGKVGHDLYLFDTLSRHLTRLTNTPDYKNYPAFSPDGKRIAYESAPDLDGPRYLYIRSLDGRHVRQLTRGGLVADSFPSFSRDGRRLSLRGQACSMAINAGKIPGMAMMSIPSIRMAAAYAA